MGVCGVYRLLKELPWCILASSHKAFPPIAAQFNETCLGISARTRAKHVLYPVCYRAPKKRAAGKGCRITCTLSVVFEDLSKINAQSCTVKSLNFAFDKRQIDDGDTFAGIGCGTGNVSKANAL